jgi:hypothetical protein
MNRRNFFAGLFGVAAVAVAPKAVAEHETGATRAARKLLEMMKRDDDRLALRRMSDISRKNLWQKMGVECPELPPYVVMMTEDEQRRFLEELEVAHPKPKFPLAIE